MAFKNLDKVRMIQTITRWSLACLVTASFVSVCSQSMASEGHRKRVISYQSKSDLFANYYEGPQPSGRTASMYVSPLPIPAHVGHTYTTYQPLMPHEYLYKHTRSHYSYVPGAPCASGGSWTRAKVRYSTYGLRLQDVFHRWSW